MNWLSELLGLNIYFGSMMLLKSWCFLGAIVFSSIVQFIWPFKNSWQENLKNWRVNIPFGFLNAVLVGAIVGSAWYGLADHAAAKNWGLLANFDIAIGFQVAIAILALDLLTYSWHRLNHTSKFLWRFHQVHHSDLVFDASTAVRFHFVEILISLLARVVVTLLLGLPLVGIIIFEIIYHVANTFQHGDIRLPLRLEKALSYLIITPAIHRLHHSQLEQDLNRNFSTIFSFWDKIFGSFKYNDSKNKFSIGLPNQQQTYSLLKLFSLPLK